MMKLVARLLYLSGILFIAGALLIYFYPLAVEDLTGMGQDTSRILAAGIGIAGLADFIIAKTVFGKSDTL